MAHAHAAASLTGGPCARSCISSNETSCPTDVQEKIEASRLPQFRCAPLSRSLTRVDDGTPPLGVIAEVLFRTARLGHVRGNGLGFLDGRCRSGRSDCPIEAIVKISIDDVDVVQIICNKLGAAGQGSHACRQDG